MENSITRKRKKQNYKITNMKIIPCGCGCGKMIESKDKKNRERRFIAGHNSKFINRDYCKKSIEDVTEWYCRALARKEISGKAKKECCFKYLGRCKGRIDVHHLDENIRNNSINNLKYICMRHHKLIHQKYIDFNSKEYPEHHVYPNGRIIYSKNKQYIKMKG